MALTSFSDTAKAARSNQVLGQPGKEVSVMLPPYIRPGLVLKVFRLDSRVSWREAPADRDSSYECQKSPCYSSARGRNV
jgi:hypothetical protein